MNRQRIRKALLLAMGLALAGGTAEAFSGTPHHDHGATEPHRQMPQETVTVFKSPTCGCCARWVDHMRAHGFKVIVHDVGDVQPVKTRHGVSHSLASCHTALVGGYVIEGHVPADLVAKLLEERPRVAGLAVPGMPMGSPGMEGPYKERYEILAFDASGRTSVYARR